MRHTLKTACATGCLALTVAWVLAAPAIAAGHLEAKGRSVARSMTDDRLRVAQATDDWSRAVSGQTIRSLASKTFTVTSTGRLLDPKGKQIFETRQPIVFMLPAGKSSILVEKGETTTLGNCCVTSNFSCCPASTSPRPSDGTTVPVPVSAKPAAKPVIIVIGPDGDFGILGGRSLARQNGAYAIVAPGANAIYVHPGPASATKY